MARRESLADLPLEVERDAAGNDWYTLRGDVRPGRPDRRSHGLRPERRLARRLPQRPRRRRGAPPDRGGRDAARHRPARRLGRRGGRALRPLALRLVGRRGLDGRPGRAAQARPTATASRCPRRSARTGSTSTGRSTRDAQLASAAAYLELHIEQGPVLESLDLPLGVVLGTFGVERHRITWTGQAAHAGSTPMDRRRDALAGAAKLALAIRDVARETGDGAVCTSGGVVCRPGIVTSVVETAEQLLDQRHLDAGKLAAMLARAQELSRGFAAEENDRRRVGADLVDRADPLRRDADRLRRRGDPRGRRDVAPPPVGAAPRRGGGLARGRPDGDALRPEPARPLAHEARGHEARAPRALRRRARPARLEDDRLDGRASRHERRP